MPKTYTRRNAAVIQLHDPIDAPTRQNAALSQVDRLLQRSLLETQSLKIVHDLLIRDSVERAQVNGHSKLLQAVTVRQETRRELPPASPDVAQHVPPTKRKPKPKYKFLPVREKEKLAQVRITGPRLVLFVMESLMAAESLTIPQIKELLVQRGSKIELINGVLAMLQKVGHIKRNPDRSYRILAPGRNAAPRMREELEVTGQCIKGDYLAPKGFSLGRGFKARKEAALNA